MLMVNEFDKVMDEMPHATINTTAGKNLLLRLNAKFAD